jgi:hypothetical protein
MRDTGSRTEADAGAYEYATADYEPDPDAPDRWEAELDYALDHGATIRPHGGGW